MVDALQWTPDYMKRNLSTGMRFDQQGLDKRALY